MTAPNIDPHHKQTTRAKSEQETTEAQQPNKIIMYTVITLVAFGVGVGLAIGFFVPAYMSKNQVGMIYSGAGIIIFATIGIAAQLLAQLPSQSPARRTEPEQPSSTQLPLVTVHDIRFRIALGEPIATRLIMKNTGTAHAVDVQIKARVVLSTDSLENTLPKMPPLRFHPDATVSTLAPGQEQEKSPDEDVTMRLSATHIADLRSGRAGAYYYGAIEYRPVGWKADVFETGFCFKAPKDDLNGPPEIYRMGNYIKQGQHPQ